MEIAEQKLKKSLILKTWECCKSLVADGTGSGANKNKKKNSPFMIMMKSKSWHSRRNAQPLTITTPADGKDNNSKRSNKTHCKVAPEGCFAVYVGPQKQRFVVKTRFANHPLFKMLLEDAESEYGHECRGPILLPCDVDLFYKVLAEMESGDRDYGGFVKASGCCSPLILLSPSHKVNRGSGQYRLLTPSRMLKMNGF